MDLIKEYRLCSLDVALKSYIYNSECKDFLSKTISKFLLDWSEFNHEVTCNTIGPYSFSKTWQVNSAENLDILEKCKPEFLSETEKLKNVKIYLFIIGRSILGSGTNHKVRNQSF